jgi:hypothetical protein
MNLLRCLVLPFVAALLIVLPAAAQAPGDGHVAITGYYVPGMMIADDRVGIIVARKADDGGLEHVVTEDGPTTSLDLPPGNYVAVVTRHFGTAEAQFTIKTGELTEVSVVLNAGTVVMTAGARTAFISCSRPTPLACERTSVPTTSAIET